MGPQCVYDLFDLVTTHGSPTEVVQFDKHLKLSGTIVIGGVGLRASGFDTMFDAWAYITFEGACGMLGPFRRLVTVEGLYDMMMDLQENSGV